MEKPNYQHVIEITNADQANALLTQLLQIAIDQAESKSFQSFQLVAYLQTQEDTDKALLTDIKVTNGKAKRKNTFSIPNVFASIISDPDKAIQEGTIFIKTTPDLIVIQDKYPAASTHVLVIPKKDGETILDMPIDAVGKLFFEAIQTATQTLGLESAKLLVNIYPPNQEVPHVHLHIMSDQASRGNEKRKNP